MPNGLNLLLQRGVHLTVPIFHELRVVDTGSVFTLATVVSFRLILARVFTVLVLLAFLLNRHLIVMTASALGLRTPIIAQTLTTHRGIVESN